jgi:hypothetical protein
MSRLNAGDRCAYTNGKDDAGWNEEQCRQSHSQDDTPNRHGRIVYLAGDDSHDKRQERDYRKPPLFGLWVLPHQLEMDIQLWPHIQIIFQILLFLPQRFDLSYPDPGPDLELVPVFEQGVE